LKLGSISYLVIFKKVGTHPHLITRTSLFQIDVIEPDPAEYMQMVFLKNLA
jgi:hypothetical protein